MNRITVRIVLDFVAVGLFMLGLAYWWLDNKVHEFAGTAMFLLLGLHTVFNRRWWINASKSIRASGGLARAAINLSLASVMVVLLATSIMISRSVFSFLPLGPAPTAREIHIMAAYWALVAVSVHLGMHWPMIISVARRVTGIGNVPRWPALVSHGLALALIATGVWSFRILGIGSKLVGAASIDFWDFNESTLPFFLHHAAVIALGAALTMYLLRLPGLRR